MLTITIDWLAINFKEYTLEAHEFIVTYASSDPIQATSPRFGYSQSQTDNNGVQLQWNPDREDMGHHVIFSGSALRNIFSGDDTQPQSLLRSCLNAGGRVSRLDLAKDCTGEAIDLQAIYQSLEQGLNTGTSRTFGQIKSSGEGHTIYVGSRQSEKFIRIYNKAAQSGISKELWFRFELETKGMFSRALCKGLVDSTEWGSIFDNATRGMVDVGKTGSFHKFFPMESVPIGLPKLERTSDREKWIEEQVIPAVSKWVIENPDSEAVRRLFVTLRFLMDGGELPS
jgi:hypothetical protein